MPAPTRANYPYPRELPGRTKHLPYIYKKKNSPHRTLHKLIIPRFYYLASLKICIVKIANGARLDFIRVDIFFLEPRCRKRTPSEAIGVL